MANLHRETMGETRLIDPLRAAELLEIRDPGLFAESLLDTAHGLAGVAEVFAYRVDEGSGPRQLISCSDHREAGDRVQAWSRRFHHSDPVRAARLGTPVGAGFQTRVRVEEIALGEYRKLCFERPRFTEKVCYGWRRPDCAIVLTFYQRRSDPDAVGRLDSLAQIAMTGLSRFADAPPAGPALGAEIERRLAAAHPILTPRERAVIARTLTGQTAREIGAELGVGAGTVMTYRQRAYQKLGCSRAAELLADS